jgi:hypothetical protein
MFKCTSCYYTEEKVHIDCKNVEVLPKKETTEVDTPY